MKSSLQNFKESAVNKDICDKKLSHSLLLISRDNYALLNYAKNLVMSLMCESEDKPCFECAECKKILHDNNVDVLYYPIKNEKTLNSAEISDLIEQAFSAPYEADKKIFVIRNANSIDAGMQNKLLKTLEEPPHNTYFILLATMDNNILPTIKSRCRIVRVPSISVEEIREELHKNSVSDDTANLALKYCDNNCDMALKYALNPNFKQTVEMVEDIFRKFRKSWQMLDFSSRLYKFNDSFEDIIEIFLAVIARATQVLNGKNLDDELAKFVVQNFSIDALVNLTKECNNIIEKRRRNCNFNAVVDYFLFMILEVRHKWPI